MYCAISCICGTQVQNAVYVHNNLTSNKLANLSHNEQQINGFLIYLILKTSDFLMMNDEQWNAYRVLCSDN